jgi:DNA-binding beta-propeller fold protein YncE
MYYAINVGSSGNVYVADSKNRIQKFDSNGNFITKCGSNGTEAGQFNSPHGIALNSQNNVYVADSGNDRIQVFAPSK